MSQHPPNKSISNTTPTGITDSIFPAKHWLRIPDDNTQPCEPGYNDAKNIQLEDLYQLNAKSASLQFRDTPQDYNLLIWRPDASLVLERPPQNFEPVATNILAGSQTVVIQPYPTPGLAENSNADMLEVFLAYSESEKDEVLFRQFSVHLEVLQRQFQKVYQQKMTFWSIHNVTGGQDWMQKIQQHLGSARIILLLVSIDFLNSRFCRQVEMTTAINRHENNTARVIPVILRICPWEKEQFGKLQPLPADRKKPVYKWRDRDEAFSKVSEGIWKAIAELLTQGQQGS
ncbi:MAG TPA: toll/interleukin-1 receptor domain-containing protein [Ktedonobacteraceae bacterium]|nr:toll/interleukin-1 receptor domain-containing protein [Ktedonobacteraceae bacterium]